MWGCGGRQCMPVRTCIADVAGAVQLDADIVDARHLADLRAARLSEGMWLRQAVVEAGCWLARGMARHGRFQISMSRQPKNFRMQLPADLAHERVGHDAGTAGLGVHHHLDLHGRSRPSA